MVYQVPINLGGHIFPTTMIILKNQDIDVILGINWIYQHKAIIDALNRTLRVSLPDSSSQLLIQLPTLRRSVERVCATFVKEIRDIPVVVNSLMFFLRIYPVYHQIGMFSLT